MNKKAQIVTVSHHSGNNTALYDTNYIYEQGGSVSILKIGNGLSFLNLKL